MVCCEKCGKNVDPVNINTIVKTEYMDNVFFDCDVDLCDDCFKVYEESRQEQLVAVHSRPIKTR